METVQVKNDFQNTNFTNHKLMDPRQIKIENSINKISQKIMKLEAGISRLDKLINQKVVTETK